MFDPMIIVKSPATSRRFWFLLLVAAILTIAVTAGYGLVSAWSLTTSPASLSVSDQQQLDLERSRHIALTLTFRSLSLAQMTADADLRATFPIFASLDPSLRNAVGFDQLIDIRSGRNIFNCSGQHFDGLYCPLAHRYAHTTLDIAVGTADEGDLTPRYDIVASVPLERIYGHISRLDEITTLRTFHWHLTLPLRGNPGRFPQDSYQLNLGLAVGASGYIEVKHSSAVNRHIARFAPGCSHDPQAFSQSSLNEVYRLSPGTVSSSLDFSCLVSSISKDFAYVYRIDFSRDPSVMWYEYAIAAIPIVFSFGFAHMLFVHPEYRKTRVQEFLVALIAAILAILPLRLVLIPPEVPGLTRVDIILGSGVVLIALIGLTRYARDIQHPTSPEQHRKSPTKRTSRRHPRRYQHSGRKTNPPRELK